MQRQTPPSATGSTTAIVDRRAQRRIHAEEVRLLYSQAPGGIVAAAVVALILGGIEMQVVSPWIAGVWIALMEVIAAARAGLCVAYRRAAPPAARAHRWGWAFISGTAATGVGWGAGVILLFPPHATGHQLFLALTCGGMAAGGVTVLAALRGAVEALLLPMFLPLALRFLAVGDEISVAIAILAVLFLAAMLIAGRRNHETITASLQLREENGVLVERLRHKEQMMVETNRLLEAEVAQRRRREPELEAMVAAAEEASRIKSQFLANVSHEIRTPINGVLGMTELLVNADLSPRHHHLAETAYASGQALLNLINNILDFSKSEADKMRLEAVDFHLPRMVEESLAILAQAAAAKGIALTCTLCPALPEVVCGDPTRLRQVITNLVGNAIKFTEQGEVALSVAAEPLTDGAKLVRFTVRDTGIGIAPEAQETIFEAFSQADGSTTRRYGGTGLGLAICRQLTELMGGTIGVQSRPGAGATFWFTAPLAVPAGPPAPTGGGSPPTPAARCRTGRILVAEDNPVNQEVALAMLESFGHRVVVVGDGRAAVAAVAEGGFDLCLMDCQMPEIDGFEATAAIREAEAEGEHLPIIALTAHAIAGYRDHCLAAGMDDYLSKPFTAGELAAVAGRWLDPAAPAPAAPPADTEETGSWSLIDPRVLAPIRTLEANGRPGLLAKVVALYLDDAPQRIAALRDAIDRGDAEAVRKAAHALKSGSANVGAATLATLCKKLEALGRNGCLGPMVDLTTEIDATYHLVSEALTAEVHSYTP